MPSQKAATRQKRGTSRRSAVVELHVVSDSTGGLGRHMLVSVLSQFPKLQRKLQFHSFCDSREKVKAALKGLKRRGSAVFSALASPELKSTLTQLCDELGIPHFDLTGGCVEFLEQISGQRASNDVSVVHERDEHYFNRIDALEFSLQHDDSRRLESIHQADIVLIGLSRVSKTPTSAYLGWLGYRVANVSVVAEAKFPKELQKCLRRTVALTITPKRLAEIRNRRFELNGYKAKLADMDRELGYCDLQSIIREVMHAEQLYRRYRIPMIDVSDGTIEETAARVLNSLGL